MRGLLLVLIGFTALGPAAAVAQAPLPTTASFSASDSPDRWNAAGGGGANSVTIALGGTVSFDVATSEPHDASFPASSGVACSAGGGPPATRMPDVPSATWSGSCSFSQPGTIAFVCTVHDTMTGEVKVAGADGSVPSGSPPPAAPGAPADPATGAPPGAVEPDGTASSLLAPVIVFARTQRGSIVRGTIANAGAGATATIEITARRRDISTARRRPPGTIRLSRTSRTLDATGRRTIAITLDARARAALRRRGRLQLALRATVRGPRIAGGSVSQRRQITLVARRLR